MLALREDSPQERRELTSLAKFPLSLLVEDLLTGRIAPADVIADAAFLFAVALPDFVARPLDQRPDPFFAQLGVEEKDRLVDPIQLADAADRSANRMGHLGQVLGRDMFTSANEQVRPEEFQVAQGIRFGRYGLGRTEQKLPPWGGRGRMYRPFSGRDRRVHV